jgi:hypothetical protein
MRGRVEVGVLLVGVLLALFTGWTVFFADAGHTGDAADRGGQPDGDDRSWIVVDEGAAVPSATPRRVRSAGPSPTVALPVAEPPAPAPSATAPCVGSRPAGQLAGLTVEPGPGTATVSWYNHGDPMLVEFRLTPIPQVILAGYQPELQWTAIAPGAGCREMTATLTGLDREAPYVFSLDAVSRNYNADGVRTVTVARSVVVYTT